MSAPAPIDIIPSATIAVPIDSKTLFLEGKISSDGSDLRVTDSACNPLDFFIQGVSERDSNIIYIAMPDIPASGSTIQLYYGSDDMVSSQMDGEAVFEFFDDFEDGEVDLTKWEVIGDTEVLVEEGGEMKFTGSFGNGGVFKYVTPAIGFDSPMTFDFTANSNSSQHYGIADVSDIERIGLRHLTGDQSNDTLDIIVYLADTLNGGFSPGILYPYVIVPRNDLNIISMSAFIDSDQKLNYTRFQNHSSKTYNLDTLTVDVYEFDALRPFFSSFGQAIRMEYVGARATPAALPEIVYGEEMELNTTSLGDFNPEKTIGIFPNPASQYVNLIPHDGIPVQIEVLDSNGKRILAESFAPRLDISSLAKGRYVLRFTYGPGVVTQSSLYIHR